MSIIKSYDDSLFSTEDAQKLYLKLIFTNYKFPKVEKCGIRKLSKKGKKLIFTSYNFYLYECCLENFMYNLSIMYTHVQNDTSSIP